MTTRTLVWWLLLLATAAGLAAVYAWPRPEADVAEPSDAGLRVLGRYVFAWHDLYEEVGRPMMREVDAQARSRTDRIRVIPLAAELLGDAEARRRIEALRKEDVDAEEAEDLRVLRRLYDEEADALAEEERARLIERHGWFGRVALTHDRPDDPARRVLESGARRAMLALVGFSLLALGAAVAGLVLFILAVVKLSGGGLRSAYLAPPRRPGDTVWLETVVILLAAVLLAVVGAGFDLHPALALALYAVLLLVPCWPLVRGVSGAEWRAGLGLQRGRGIAREIGAGLVGYLACIPIFAVGVALTVLLATATDARVSHPAVDEIGAGDGVGLAGLFLAACVWAPWVEETVFRGALYRYLRSRTATVWAAALVGFLFALVHPQGLATIPALMSLGAILALLRQWRGSLIASMTAHAAHNLVLVGLVTLILA
ncbi:MAG: lysostaphin resistance A-like protein [Planctomycetota bacterium]|jgi:membrane protease YdiL (CAAX protease family)